MKIQTILSVTPTWYQKILHGLRMWTPNQITITVDTEHMAEAKLESDRPVRLKHEFTTHEPSKKITLKGERCPRGEQ